MTIKAMKQELDKLIERETDLQFQIEQFELEPSDYEDQYIELLDDEGTVTAGGLEFYPSRILSELDPIAYSCGLSDYADSCGLESSEEYNRLCEELEELQDKITELDEEIYNLEMED
jgi:cell division protein FtsB